MAGWLSEIEEAATELGYLVEGVGRGGPEAIGVTLFDPVSRARIRIEDTPLLSGSLIRKMLKPNQTVLGARETEEKRKTEAVAGLLPHIRGISE